MTAKTKFARLIIPVILISLFLPAVSSAAGVRRLPLENNNSDLSTSIFGVDDSSPAEESAPPVSETTAAPAPEVTPPVEEPSEPVSCQFDMPDDPVYDAQFVAVRKKGVVAKGEIFETVVYVKNTGNVPWFSSDSGCPYVITNLGTDRERDRSSMFFTDDLMWESGWLGENRIAMTTGRVEPNELAEFTFWSRAPQQDGYFREFFTPVIEGITWMNNGVFFTDTRVGDGFLDLDKKELLKYVESSSDLTKLNVEGDKSITVSISKQKMWLRIGDVVIREFPVSTGTYRTPTPLGTTTISHKQEVRVASGWPHYIMPKWMTYRAGGFGIHALPSLANDNGVFWREALNHIGTRRSHGCIRLLPQDAEFAYSFADIGTTVNVVN